MSRTAMDHDLVRSYLSELDFALRAVPLSQARELREQITAHLDDALPPDAGDEQVAAVLDRLGSPASLAADLRPAGTPRAALAMTGAWLQARLARVRGKTWMLAGAAAVVIALLAGYLGHYPGSGTLRLGDAFGWWYPRDYLREVTTTADGRTQTTVPVRSGQRQGYLITIYNPTDVTQTILAAGSTPDSPAGDRVRIGVSVPNRNISRGGFVRNVRFTLPGAIPPHQTREVRVLWTSTVCLEKGSAEGIDQVSFRVRVGWFTRTEVIGLDEALYLSGPSQGPCN